MNLVKFFFIWIENPYDLLLVAEDMDRVGPEEALLNQDYGDNKDAHRGVVFIIKAQKYNYRQLY
jgi:hypothetical protein